MFEKIQKIIDENNLQLFTKQSIQKRLPLHTREARAVYTKTLNKLQSYMYFQGSISLVENLPKEITKELANIQLDNSILNQFEIKESWKLPYDLLLITENEDVYKQGKKRGWPIELIHEHMLQDLDSYDIIRAFDTPNCESHLDDLEQCYFVNSPAELYPEEQLVTISKWEKVLNLLTHTPFPEVTEAVANLQLVTPLLSPAQTFSYDSDELSLQLPSIQKLFTEKVKASTLSGADVIAMMSNQTFPEELNQILKSICDEKQFPYEVIQKTFPLTLNEDKISEQNKESKQNEWHGFMTQLKKQKDILQKTPRYINTIKTGLLVLDICGAISAFGKEYETSQSKESTHLSISNSKNMLIQNPQPISYYLDKTHQGALLTGANSGGKTTLLEHVLQSIILHNLGWPVTGNAEIPKFHSIYYFAKNKGSANKGAFETMLTQLSKIKPEKALILADEMEAVTEPGIASQIIATTLNYFTKAGAQCIFATHLGKDIIPYVKESIRIDGIKAIGIENNTVIIDHNPKIGELANSTPELIIEKMAQKPSIYLNTLLSELRKT